MTRAEARREIIVVVNHHLLAAAEARREALRQGTRGYGQVDRLLLTLSTFTPTLVGARQINRAVHIARRLRLVPDPVLKIAGFRGGSA